MNNQYFSLGEFAELCKTTRASLYHYEKHGLLMPKVNEKNGYRFYEPSDYYTFNFIVHMANIGYTLNEISEHLKNLSIESYLELETSGIKRSEELIKKIELRNERTQRGVEYMRSFINTPLKCPQIVYKEEAFFFKLPLPEDHSEYDSIKVQAYTDNYALENGLDRFRHFVGFYIDEPFKEKKEFNAVLGQIIEPKPCDKLFIRPAGMYISMCFPGPIDHCIDEIYRLMKEYLDIHHFTHRSGLLIEVVIGPFHTKKPEEYISEVTIQIE